MQQKNMIQEDEIDLRELFLTLWKKRVFIGVFTILVTFVGVLYTFVKNPTPIYQGKILIEIGGIYSNELGFQQFDNPNNLALITQAKFPGVKASTPIGTNNLIEISSTSTNKSAIKQSLQEISKYISDRHQKLVDLYKTKKYNMTNQIGDVVVENKPINETKQSLIISVAFVTGFILSIFLVFFMEFIRSFKNEDR